MPASYGYFRKGMYETYYGGDKIKVVNKMTATMLYINDELVSESKGQNSVVLEGKLSNGEILIAVVSSKGLSAEADIFAGNIDKINMHLEKKDIAPGYFKFTGEYDSKKISVYITGNIELFTIDDKIVFERWTEGTINSRFNATLDNGKQVILYQMGNLTVAINL